MADATIFPEGVRFFEKNAKQPAFVKGSIVITMKDLLSFVNSHPDYLTEYNGNTQLRLQLLEGKTGATYLAVDTFKPKAKEPVEDLPF